MIRIMHRVNTLAALQALAPGLGIEEKVLELCRRHNVTRYFFLDVSFPSLIKLVKAGEYNVAIRYSEYEPVEHVLALQGKVAWVWVDCFNMQPLTRDAYHRIKPYFKLCLVSPELQQHGKSAIAVYRKELDRLGVKLDAVCTDFPDLWQDA